MPEIDVNPFLMEDCVLNIAADDFAAACSSIAFTPASTASTFKGLKRTAVFSFQSAASWVLGIIFAQDLTEGSLSRYLHAHEGETKAVEFIPLAGGPSIVADVIISAAAFGGAQGAVPTSTVSFGVQGRPEFDDTP